MIDNRGAFVRAGAFAGGCIAVVLLTALVVPPRAPIVIDASGSVAIAAVDDAGEDLAREDLAPFGQVVRLVIFRRPDPPAPAIARMVGITATVFADHRRRERSAYGGRPVSSRAPGCALPFRFVGERPRLRVFRRGHAVECPIVDVGPWLINDAYWQRPGGRPAVEELHRRRRPAYGGKVPTNMAAIDVTPAIARALDLGGRGLVDWEFVE